MDRVEKYIGNCIEDFMEILPSLAPCKMYYHNMQFDGNFILSYIMHNGYECVDSVKDEKQFSTIISDMGQFYNIKIGFKIDGKLKCVDIMDSYKLIPKSVEEIAEKFKLPVSKLKIDYDEYREPGHELTKQEYDYVMADVEIMRQALNIFFAEGLDKMTIGSNAMAHYKSLITPKMFKRLFPPPIEYDKEIRQAYKGGWCLLQDGFSDVDVGEGIVLDVNSLYPYCQGHKLLPYGEGVAFKGKYRQDNDYPLYIIAFTCSFEIRQGYLPMIQLKNTPRYKPTEYLSRSIGEETLCLSSIDLQLFFKHYKVYNIQWHGGWKFKAKHGMFTSYVDYWVGRKINAEIEFNMALREICKLYLNNLYGKFSKRPLLISRKPVLDDKGIVRYKIQPGVEVEPVYIPVGIFVTAYAREKTITAAQDNIDRFIYSDTDSIHLMGRELPAGLEIDKYKLGAWKLEMEFDRARYIRPKCYLEENSEKTVVKCSGLPATERKKLNWDNFHPGYKTYNKLTRHNVLGGTILQKTEFEIRA